MPLDIALDIRTLNGDTPPFGAGAFEHAAREHSRQSAALKLLGDFGVREDDRAAALDVRNERGLPVDVRLELTGFRVVDDRNLLLAARCVRHLNAVLPDEVPCATIASTSAGIVDRAASTRTSSPASRAAADVVGPIVATPTRRAQSTP